MPHTTLAIRTVVSQPFAENSYVVWIDGRSDALVIDPGTETGPILAILAAEARTVAAILNTHGHLDHIAGNETMKDAFPDAPLIIGEGDVPLLTDPMANLSAWGGEPVVSPDADRAVCEGETIEVAGITFEVLDVPGHSPGHVVFVCRTEPPTLFGGDVLFKGSIGRYDFPGSDGPLLLRGIRSKLFALPSDTVVYSGHGPITTIGEEQRTNPFVGVRADEIP